MYIISALPAIHVLRSAVSFVCRHAVGKTLCGAVVAGLLVLAAAPAAAQPAIRQILVLQSFHRGNQPLDYFTANFRVELGKRLGVPVNFVEVAVGHGGLASPPGQAVIDFIRASFANRPTPDLIVAVAGPAVAFARTHRQELFPGTPLLLATADRRYFLTQPLGDTEAAVPVDVDPIGFVNEIVRLLPRTRQLFVVTGSGPTGEFWRPTLEAEFKQYGVPLDFIWSDDLSLQEILRRSATLPPGTAIVYLAVGTDADGAAYADERVLADLHAAANAPMFGLHSSYMGAGIVGGALLPMPDITVKVADAAARLLNGAAPAAVSSAPILRGQPTFDWRELQRWKIPESGLPANSIVLYRGPSLWREHRVAVLNTIGLVLLQSVLIGALLYQRRARQRAEVESRKNLALAADTSRRATMSALTSSISHELGQPLSAMIHNAHALQMMVTTDRATADTLGEILSEIEAQGVRATQIIDRHRVMLRSRQLEMRPTDLHAVVNESLALVAHDMTARQITCTTDLTPQPCMVNGDHVLLQQVLVNLMVNAMDAMADTPAARRHMTIKTRVRGDEAEVSVRDAGTGLPPQLDGTLFTPFVTTKSHGLGIGLTIARTIVSAHEGGIDAHNNPDGGATFTVTLRRAGARARAAQ